MSENLLPDQTEQSQSSASTDPRPIKPLIELDAKIRLFGVHGKDCTTILEMIRDAVACFDDTVETRSGKTYSISLEVLVVQR